MDDDTDTYTEVEEDEEIYDMPGDQYYDILGVSSVITDNIPDPPPMCKPRVPQLQHQRIKTLDLPKVNSNHSMENLITSSEHSLKCPVDKHHPNSKVIKPLRNIESKHCINYGMQYFVEHL